jgi:hypothetical protein
VKPIRKCASRGLTKVSEGEKFTFTALPPELEPVVASLHTSVHALFQVLVNAYGPPLGDTNIVLASIAYAVGEAASFGKIEHQEALLALVTNNVAAGFRHGPGNKGVKEG